MSGSLIVEVFYITEFLWPFERMIGTWIWNNWPPFLGLVSSLYSCGPLSTCWKKAFSLIDHSFSYLSCIVPGPLTASLWGWTWSLGSHPCDCSDGAVNHVLCWALSQLLPSQKKRSPAITGGQMGDTSHKSVLNSSMKCPTTSLPLSQGIPV